MLASHQREKIHQGLAKVFLKNFKKNEGKFKRFRKKSAKYGPKEALPMKLGEVLIEPRWLRL